MTVNIYMVRHGETYFNLLHRFQGWSDAPLTEKGIQDGYAAGTRLAKVHFHGAYSSDLTRAIHTSRYILANNTAKSPREAVQLPDFREENFGSFEGVHTGVVLTTLSAYKNDNFSDFSDVITKYGMPAAMNLVNEGDPFNLAENYQQFITRIRHGFEDIQSRHHDGDNILIVSHGTTIRAIADYFGYQDFAKVSVKNGAIMQLELNEHDVKITNFNDDTTVF
ncbi:phosphoglycerate mutase [Leuconostoc litchii]|uniref:Histidine phosphatase family protein n=1 Tax=Leuconostoc litchii TaxID=1981069 RepID=A0A6P2CQI7_9LACO|nr:histidine phosphatase family protein [Leuconostoc litchii]TYC47653.1 histidine phosphatase family protein [Leuconostoc litchii]GMA69703.1 phosphoglycerate mutase [Leuconostoc litchii]